MARIGGLTRSRASNLAECPTDRTQGIHGLNFLCSGSTGGRRHQRPPAHGVGAVGSDAGSVGALSNCPGFSVSMPAPRCPSWDTKLKV